MYDEIVVLEEKLVAGLCARTSNAAPDMSAVIGGLWKRFYEEGIYASIPNKKNDRALGLYSDYEKDETGAYDITVCCEVTSAEGMPEGIAVKTIPGGRYAKFIVKGGVQAVGAFWKKLWRMKLPRSFTGDFEEYLPLKEGEEPEIHIYIALKG